MAEMESVSLLVALASIALALVFATISFIQLRITARRKPKGRREKLVNSSTNSGHTMNILANTFVVITFICVTLTIVGRGIVSGHAPFSSMYEFAIAFAWGIIVMGIVSRWRYKTAALQNIGLIVALFLLIFAAVQHSRPASLVPALQQSTLLSAHVAAAVVAYGTLTIGFGAAILFLIQNRRHSPWFPDSQVLDRISYHSVVVGFPFLTLLIVLGALWADIAWGNYWSWDPKETASLVTWLIYAGYLHARIMRGWQGNRAAILLIAGFAAILLTFFGNYFFSGLHAYG